MKIIYYLIITLYISACSNIHAQDLYKNDITKSSKSEVVCKGAQEQRPEINLLTEEKSIFVLIGRIYYNPLHLYVINNENESTLYVEMFCDINQTKKILISSATLTAEQMSEIYSLYENIDISKLPIVGKETNAASLGYSYWQVLVVENKKDQADLRALTPGYYPETEGILKLGEYLLNLAEIVTPLKYKEITRNGIE